jgi:5'-nucleotidase
MNRIDLRVSRRTHDVVRVRAANSGVTQDVPRAADMTELLDHYSEVAAPERRRVIGSLARAALRRRDSSRESSLGNLVADAQRRAGRADAAFVNPGTLRADLGAGKVTFGEAFDVQPFGTRIVTMTLTGAKLMTLLKQQWCGQKAGRVLQPSATVRYTWSASAAGAILGRRCAGARNPVTGLRVRRKRVSARRRYRVAVNSSMAGEASSFLVLRSGARQTTGPEDTEALERYFAPSLDGEPVSPPGTRRIARVR